MNFIAQGIGILGMAMNSISYQAKTQRNIIMCQLFGSLFFAINYIMLGAFMGGLLNTIGVFRALVYVNKDKLKNIKLWTVLFFALYIASYIATFTLLGKEPTFKNFLVEILPLIGMSATNIGFIMKDAKSVRYSAFVSSPSWLIYNCVNFTIGGIICEALTLISTTTALIRHDLKNANKTLN